MELLRLLSASEILAQIAGFLILLFLLKVFAWKKILRLLEQRKERIAFEFRNIDNAKLEVAALKADYEKKLAQIEETAQKRIQEAVAQGKVISEEARKQAHLAAQEIIDNAKANIKYEITRAKSELKDEIIDMTIHAAENLIREKLTEKEDRQLVRDFLEGIDKV